jgi:hypothetical protein
LLGKQCACDEAEEFFEEEAAARRKKYGAEEG